MPSALKSDIKNARKCENINDPVDTYIVDYIAMFFSRIFIKLHIIPNAVTVLSAIAGVTGGVLLCLNSLLTEIFGVVFIILAAVFDASDGQVARLTKHYSNLGRTLDGFADFLTYFSMYAAICVRLFNENIPFTERPWGFLIIPVALIAILFFGAQARTLDYYKNLHMFILTRGEGSELSRSREIKKQIAESEKFSFERLRLKFYLSYTSMQEKKAPATQKLLEKIEERGGAIPDEVCDAFYAKSRKYVMASNLIAFNIRTIVFIILLFLPGHLELLYFPFVVFILEPIRLIIISKYEKLSLETVKILTDTEE